MSPSVGYPDFARLATYGGYEITTGGGTYSSGDTVFSGFCGSWPYLNVYVLALTSDVYCQFEMKFYADSALSQIAGTVKFNRGPNISVNTQYAALGPYCEISVFTSSGGSVDLDTFNVYGTYGGAGPARLAPSVAPLCYLYTTMAAGANDTVAAATVAPGPAVLVLRAGVSSWALYVNYYDFASAGFLTWWSADSNVAGYGGSWLVPLPDTQVEIQVFNNATTANAVKCMLLPGSY